MLRELKRKKYYVYTFYEWHFNELLAGDLYAIKNQECTKTPSGLYPQIFNSSEQIMNLEE